MQLRPRIRLPFRLRRRAERASVVTLFASLLLVEGIGRRFQSDVGDAAVLGFIGLVAGWCAVLHNRAALEWVTALRRSALRVWSFLHSRSFDIGVDLRREPPIRRGVPTILVVALAALAALLALATVWLVLVRLPLRSVVAPLFYLGWLTALACLWTALGAAIVVMMFSPPAYIHDQFVAHWTRRTRRPRRVEFLVIAAYFVSVLVAGLLLPVWVAVASMAVAVVVAGSYVWVPPRRQLNLLWRERRSKRTRAIEWSTFLTLLGPAFALPFLLLALVSLGPAALGLAGDTSATPITAFLGRLAAWLSAWGLCLLSGVWAHHAHVLRRNDPEPAAPTVLHVTGADNEDDLDRIERLLRERGWRARFPPAPPAPTDVRIELVDHARAQAASGRGDTLRVARAALDIPEFHDVLARRDVEQRRRILLDCLQEILERAERRHFRRGTGFWIAPQYWWVSAMTRDDYEESEAGEDGTVISEVIPPYYHRVIPRPARHHFHEVSRALGVDLILIEDGVGVRGLSLVMRRMFEHYERHSGKRLVQESDFRMLPRIRVILHDYELDRPLNREKYPEPDYEDLARARILHIFKDREEPPEDWTLPFDLDSLLDPIEVG